MTLRGRASARFFTRHPWQLGLSLLGIALGVAGVVAVDLANESARRAFQLSTAATAGSATHAVTAGSAGVPEELVRLLRVDLAVDAAPVVEALAALADRPGEVARILGIDPLIDLPFRDFLGTRSAVDLTRLLAEPGSVLLSTGTAARWGVAPGDRLALRLGTRRVEAVVLGLFTPGDESRAAVADLLLADLATAQELAGRPGRLTRIDLRLAEGEAGGREAARLAAGLPPGVVAAPSASRPAALEQMTRAFRLNLTALSLLALVCGAFLIYNTMTFSVLQRRPLLGTLRALGVSRQELMRTVLGEAAILGLVGSLAGLALGAALGEGLLRLVSRTLRDLYFAHAVTELTLSPLSLGKGLALGVVASLLAAWRPAREAAATPPRLVQLRSAAEESTRRLMPRLALAGLAALAAGALFLAAPRGALSGAFAGLFLVLLGGAALVPPALALLLALTGRLAGRSGLLLRLAARSLARSLSRTGVAVAALTLAVAVTVGVDLMIGSFRGAVVTWLDRTLAADLYVSSPDRLGGAAEGALPPTYIETLRALPGVRRLAVLSAQEVSSALGPLRVLALDLAGDDGRARGSFTLLDGEARTVWAEVETGAALITEPLATRHGLSRGARVRLHSDRGPREVTVAGVVRDYGSEAGALLLARPVYLDLWNAPEALAVSLTAEADADLERLAARARAAVPAGSAVQVESRRALREGSLAIFDRTFLITSVLRLLTLAVAVVGVLSALMALALERGREIAVLRANGLTPRQLLRLVTLETTLMGAAAGLLAMPFGAALAAVMVHVINRRSFGWSMELVLAPRALLEGMAAATLAALLAGLYPAWRMARTSTAAALRDE